MILGEGRRTRNEEKARNLCAVYICVLKTRSHWCDDPSIEEMVRRAICSPDLDLQRPKQARSWRIPIRSFSVWIRDMMYEKRERERELHPCTCCLLGRTAVVVVVLITFLLKGGKREPGFIPGLSVAFRNIYKQSHTDHILNLWSEE
jgi:hypothetical protein